MDSRDIEFATPIASTASNFSINNFQQFFLFNSLKLRPAFQRNLVWNEDQQSFLIDTILRGLPIPEVYLQTSVSADGNEEKIVVDGQQRITACLKFLNGKLRLIDSSEFDDRWRGKRFSELEDGLQRRFRTYKLIARELPELDADVLREVFRRLNRTVEPLEAQELRHAAYTSPFVTFIERASAHSTLGDVGVFSAKDYQRRRNDEFIAEITLAVRSRAFPNKKEGLDDMFLTFERNGVPDEFLVDLKRRFGRLFDELSFIGQTLRRTRFRNKSDFYTLAVFLLKKADRLPLASQRNAFVSGLSEFSTRVNDIKRAEADSGSGHELAGDTLGTNSLQYLLAVERAASDRLNRVRRETALAAILGPIVDAEESRSLSDIDSKWYLIEPVEDDPADAIIGEAERERLQRLLLESTNEPDLDRL